MWRSCGWLAALLIASVVWARVPRDAGVCARAPLSAGQAWVETVSVTEQHRSEPSRPDSDLPDTTFRRRSSIEVLAAGDGGITLVSRPLDAGASETFLTSDRLWWPIAFEGQGGSVFRRIVSGGPVELVSRKATRHRLGPAHVYEVADGDGDTSASCGGLVRTWSERVSGTITVLDGTSLIVAATLVDDESEENDRRFLDELEDGGVVLITGHWSSAIHRTATVEVSCE